MIRKGKMYNMIFMSSVILSSLGYESHLFNYYSYIQVAVSSLCILLLVLYMYEDSKLDIKGNKLLYIMLFLMIINSTTASIIYNKNTFSNIFSVPVILLIGILMYVIIPKLMYKYNNIMVSFTNYITYFCFGLALLSIIMELNGGSFLIWQKPYSTRTASIYYDPNFYANIIGCGFALIVIRNDLSWKTKIIYLITIGYSLYLTGSRGTLLSLIFSILLYIIFFSNLKKLQKLSLLSILTCLVAKAYIYLDSTDYFRLFQGSNNRLEMWDWALNQILESPFIGYGYGSIGMFLSNNEFTNASTHNSFVDYAFSYGLICTILYLYLIIKIIYKAFINRASGPILVAVLFMLINSNTILYSFGGVGFSSILLTIFLGILNFNDKISRKHA